MQSILDRKGQVILYGPPGTGKTYWAQRAAEAMLAYHFFTKSPRISTEDERAIVERHIRLCTFHPAYGYEDFLEGYRPEEHDGRLVLQPSRRDLQGALPGGSRAPRGALRPDHR